MIEAPRALRSAASLFLVLVIACCGLTACSNEAEKVVETWEDLATLIAEKQGECRELSVALDEFREEHAPAFSADVRPIYEEIDRSPELRFRMERAYAGLQSSDLPCRDDVEVQRAAKELFKGLLALPD